MAAGRCRPTGDVDATIERLAECIAGAGVFVQAIALLGGAAPPDGSRTDRRCVPRGQVSV